MSQTLKIILGSKKDLELKFKIRPTDLANLWVERMMARHQWPLDHPDRFTGFDNASVEKTRAIQKITSCIDLINSHRVIIERPFEYTQDCWNYLHNIFEQYHGLLDQQNSDFWNTAPNAVRKALAELNLNVHRCESASKGSWPRLVCTWFGMPKIKCLSADLQKQHGTTNIKFGQVYLNYCDIGKTLEDLSYDNDHYIGDNAFQPFNHYSADFNVAFFDFDLANIYQRMQTYIDQHKDFFVARGIESVYNIQAQPLRFPVADLEYHGDKHTLLTMIAQRQLVQQITLE